MHVNPVLQLCPSDVPLDRIKPPLLRLLVGMCSSTSSNSSPFFPIQIYLCTSPLDRSSSSGQLSSLVQFTSPSCSRTPVVSVVVYQIWLLFRGHTSMLVLHLCPVSFLLDSFHLPCLHPSLHLIILVFTYHNQCMVFFDLTRFRFNKMPSKEHLRWQ